MFAPEQAKIVNSFLFSKDYRQASSIADNQNADNKSIGKSTKQIIKNERGLQKPFCKPPLHL
jgi:hypothetical protein